MKAQAMSANPVSDKAAHLRVSWAGGLARSCNSQSHLTHAALDRPAAEDQPGDGTQSGRQEC